MWNPFVVFSTMKSSTLVAGIFSVGIYISVLLLLVLYIDSTQTQKPVHFVKKNEDAIRISMASVEVTPKEIIPVTKPTKKEEPQRKDRAKKEKDTDKKVLKEKIVKKVKPKKPKTPPKKVIPKKINKPKDLFASVSTPKKPKNKPKKALEKIKPKKVPPKVAKASASDIVSDSFKQQKTSDKGKVNAYGALVESKLYEWSGEAEFAGEHAVIRLKIQRNGKFSFKILRSSSNVNFKDSLKAYLTQLQRIGFTRHDNSKGYYEFDVEFEAKE
ncbi:MAG: TonB C-terminal domain-containing protein [Sulfurovum sp.]|nr:TonB C-terminal domain-containing protein [Sulfurovum sp.]